MSGTLKSLMRREVDRQRDHRIGTVLSEMRLTDFDSGGSGVFVVDIEIGSNNYLHDVPVKGLRDRFHAQLQQTVELRRGAQGRWEVVGPGNRALVGGGIKTYDLSARTNQTTTTQGWVSDRVDFDYYQTVDGAAPLGVLFGDGVTPFGFVRIVAV